ncbi:hypothetical protein [Gallibacterium anatis]|uniref:hypothetical protein n=1 Tax=Gallibacterium anatis TaxID=750 RepID=UPI00068A26A4|nr:hypothetical protein [Gallibacterium anatis]
MNFKNLTLDGIYKKYNFNSFKSTEISDQFINTLIEQKMSFSIEAENIQQEVERVERLIEAKGFSCRVYTENRSLLCAGSLGSGSIKQLGLLSLAYIAIHNLITIDPDFEIGRNFMSGRVNITYKK